MLRFVYCAGICCCISIPPASAQTVPATPVATVDVEGGHRVDFFAPSGGPTAIAEVGPMNTTRVVTEEMLKKKPSEIFSTLSRGRAVPPALFEAERRVKPTIPVAPPQRPKGVSARTGKPGSRASSLANPHFLPPVAFLFDAGNQQWFKNTFCHPDWECVQGWSWANSSGGHHAGRGYAADAINGSEARALRNLETDWWNGSSWASLVVEAMPPGWWAWTNGGNVGAATCHDQTWYFKSEVLDNGTGDNATVSLADHMYAPGSPGPQTVHMSCYSCNCDCGGCDACPTGRGGGNFILCHLPTTCPGDSCVNPP